MKINIQVPAYIDADKVFEWNELTTLREQVFPDRFKDEVGSLCNWVIFYAWCYSKTQGFTNKCLENWDVANFGGKFRTLADGIKDALAEFLKYPDTESMAEQKEVERIYKEIDLFCQGVVYNEPKPVPVPELPSQPVPKVEKPAPVEKPTLPKSMPWVKIGLAIITISLGLFGALMPSWLKAILSLIMSIIGG